MIPITRIPTLHLFLARLFHWYGLTNQSVDEIKSILASCEVISQCQCQQKDCATVWLRCKDLEDLSFEDSEDIDTNKGMIFLHKEADGEFELEALDYNHYPYKEELMAVLNGSSCKCNFNEAEQKIEKYFYGLKYKNIQTIIVE